MFQNKKAGFKNKTDGHFTEVMHIQSPADEKEFKETNGVETSFSDRKSDVLTVAPADQRKGDT